MSGSPTPIRTYLAMLFLFALVLAGTVWVMRRPEPAVITLTTPTPRPTATTALILVDVRGAVHKPGVYSLPAGSRVQDALTLAEELTADAEVGRLNFARKLNDGEQIFIATRAEATQTVSAAPVRSERLPAETRTPIGKININTATVEQLDVLPGIGPAIGQRIIDYRAQNGNFAKIDDIKNVRGIGDAVFDQIKDLITVQ